MRLRLCGMCLRLCLRRWWTLNRCMDGSRDLPSFELSQQQAIWLRGARSRLLRRADIAHRQTIVELGAGWGIVASELCQRTGRRVTAIDPRPRPSGVELHPDVDWMVGRAEALPLPDASVDLLFAQFTFLWLDLERAVQEVVRVLAPGGMLAVIEPDYGGMMEYPPETVTAPIWNAALKRAGADPCIGRKLPVVFAQAGLRTEIRLPDRYEHPPSSRLEFLAELNLEADEHQQIGRIRALLDSRSMQSVAHLPLWLVLAEKTN